MAGNMNNLMTIAPLPELDTEQGTVLHEMTQILNYIVVAPTINRQELATKVLGVAKNVMDTFGNHKAKVQALGLQLDLVTQQLEKAVASAPPDGDSKDSESSEESEDEDDSSSPRVQQMTLMEQVQQLTQTITSSSAEYSVENILGSGSFGVVVQCMKKPSNEMVALKITRDDVLDKTIEEAKEEVALLKSFKDCDSERFNVVNCRDSFMFENLLCFELRLLDISLESLISTRKSLDLREIRAILQQMAVGLGFLKDMGIIHSDLKPDNIMLVDHVRQPLKVQIIDFGEAMRDPENWVGATFQTLLYRAPEVLLGVLVNCAIDMWSVACIAVEMLRGAPMFDIWCKRELMESIVTFFGHPPDNILAEGKHTERYFNKINSSRSSQGWVLKSSISPEGPTNPKMELFHHLPVPDAEQQEAAVCDWFHFIDLLQKMFDVNASKRITPQEMLSHPFITASHLRTPSFRSYVKSSDEYMRVCNNWSPNEGEEAQQPDTPHRSARCSGSPSPIEDKTQSRPSDCTAGTKEETPLDAKSSAPKNDKSFSPSEREETEVEEEDPKTSSSELSYQKQLDKLKSLIREKQEKIDELLDRSSPQFARNNNLVVYGLHLTRPSSVQTTAGRREGEAASEAEYHEILQQVVDFFSSRDILVDRQHVLVRYALPQTQDHRSKVVLHFDIEAHKDEVLEQSGKLKDTGVKVEEHLSEQLKDILWRARVLTDGRQTYDFWTSSSTAMTQTERPAGGTPARSQSGTSRKLETLNPWLN